MKQDMTEKGNKKFSLPAEENRVVNIKEEPDKEWDSDTENADKTVPPQTYP